MNLDDDSGEQVLAALFEKLHTKWIKIGNVEMHASDILRIYIVFSIHKQDYADFATAQNGFFIAFSAENQKLGTKLKEEKS